MKLTEEQIKEYNKRQREDEQKKKDIYFAKRDKITEKFEALGIFPITQHPHYHEDTAYDIDDIIELLESVIKK